MNFRYDIFDNIEYIIAAYGSDNFLYYIKKHLINEVKNLKNEFDATTDSTKIDNLKYKLRLISDYIIDTGHNTFVKNRSDILYMLHTHLISLNNYYLCNKINMKLDKVFSESTFEEVKFTADNNE